jgi:hypothetical protein
MLKIIAAAAAAAAALGLAACGEGGAERAGEDLDSAIEETTQGAENLGDGALERAGEGLDNATGANRDGDLGDAVSDATDGDRSTTP